MLEKVKTENRLGGLSHHVIHTAVSSTYKHCSCVRGAQKKTEEKAITTNYIIKHNVQKYRDGLLLVVDTSRN